MTKREQLIEQYEDALFALLMDSVAEEEGKKAIELNERLKADPEADPGKIVQAVRKVLQSPVLPPLDRGEQIEGQGKQPDHRVQGPDGPEAAEVFAVEGGIKA